MYVQVDTPEQLDSVLNHQCKYCYNPDATHTISWPMHKAGLELSTGFECLYTYAAHCKSCGGLSVVVLRGLYPELDEQFIGLTDE